MERGRTRARENADTTISAPNLYEYPAEIADAGRYVNGFDVQATDGTIGAVETASYSHGRSFLVVGTDSCIFREKRLLPAGIVRGVTPETRKLFIGMTKNEIRNAPEYDAERHRADELMYLEAVGRYYQSSARWPTPV